MAGLATQIDDQRAVDFQQNGSVLSQALTRFNANITHVSEESAKSWLLQKLLIGATAQNLLEQHGQANMQTQLKSSGMFPGVQSVPAPGTAGKASDG